MPSYGTVAGGDLYFATRLIKEGWEKSSSAQKEAALNEGTEMVDNLNYIGVKADEAQENQFPRGTDTVVPDSIITANYDIANQLLEGFDPEYEFENLNLRERTYAQAKSTYETTTPLPHLIAGIPSSRAWRKIVPYLRDPSALVVNRVS